MSFLKPGPVLLISIIALAGVPEQLPAQVSNFTPVSDKVLNNPDPADWLRWRRDNTANGYSPLDQVNRSNVKTCAWHGPGSLAQVNRSKSLSSTRV